MRRQCLLLLAAMLLVLMLVVPAAAVALGRAAAEVKGASSTALSRSVTSMLRSHSPLLPHQARTRTASFDGFGYAVAISGDTAVIGAPDYNTESGPDSPGAAFVYTRSGASWAPQQMLLAGDGADGDGFGQAVDVDGDVIVVGANYHHNASGDNAGAAYVFTRSGSAWTQVAELSADDGSYGQEFGAAVAVSGGTALVGAHLGHDDWGETAGAAYVFSLSGGSWTQQAKLTAYDSGYYEHFGSCVALDGDTALVGANGHDVWGMDWVGAGYVFVRSGGDWELQQELNPDESTEGDNIGSSVALQGDTAVLGAPNEYVEPDNLGNAYVFRRSGGGWTEEARLQASDGTDNDGFGESVSLAGDRVLVGAYSQDAGGVADSGAAYIFAHSGASWSQNTEIVNAGGSSGTLYGLSVALSPTAALVGEPWRTVGGRRSAGAVWTYDLSGTTWSVGTRLTSPAPSPSQSGPTLTRLKPVSGKRGATVTITGKGLGKKRGASYVKFGTKKCTKYLSWSTTRIKCKVPAKATFGKVRVTVVTAGGKSNAKTFTVKR